MKKIVSLSAVLMFTMVFAACCGDGVVKKEASILSGVVKQETYTKVTTSYIGNKNSKKFHYTYCSSVKKMKDSNKVYLECTRDEAISDGYSPCGNCKP